MKDTPKGMRLHIGLFGRRNVGKSSLLNALTRQQVSIVSDVPGTTTDPVEKPMELLPLGPVLFIDTAGIDDVGALGEMRAERTRQRFRADRPGHPGGRRRTAGESSKRASSPNCANARRPSSSSSTRPIWRCPARRCCRTLAVPQARRASKQSPARARACSSCGRP